MCPISFSYSTKPIPRNNAKQLIGKALWQETEGNFTDIVRIIKSDKAICNNFHHCGEIFTTTEKTKFNLKSAYLILFDFDAVELSAKYFFEAMSNTEIPPTIVYTTANNGKKKYDEENFFNRFRVIYLLNQPIHEWWLYERVHEQLENEIFLTVGIKNDKSDHTCEHLFCGNANAEIYTSDSSFDNDFLIERYGIDLTAPNNVKKSNKGEGKKREKHSSEVIDDYWNLPLWDFFNKYHYSFLNIMATVLEESADKRTVEIPKDYLEIYRKWHVEEKTKNSGEIMKISVTDRVKQGERNRTLYNNLCIRRQITPTLSFENLLFNAVYELLHHIDNADGSLTRSELYNIVQSAFNQPLETLNYKCYNKPTYKISKAYCRKHGTTAKEAQRQEENERRAIRKSERDKKVIALSNSSLTLEQNLSLLKTHGISISKSTLKRIYSANVGQSEEIYTQHNVYNRNEPKLHCKRKILDLLEKDGSMTTELLAKHLNVSVRTIKNYFLELKKEGKLKRKGSDKNGTWVVCVNVNAQSPNK